jgi:hypothetical protein
MIIKIKGILNLTGFGSRGRLAFAEREQLERADLVT